MQRDFLILPNDATGFAADAANSLAIQGIMQAMAIKVYFDIVITTAQINVGAAGNFHFGIGLYDLVTLQLQHSFPNFDVTKAGLRQVVLDQPRLIKAGIYLYACGVESGGSAITYITAGSTSALSGQLRAGAGLMGQSTNGVGSTGIPPAELQGFKKVGFTRIPICILN